MRRWFVPARLTTLLLAAGCAAPQPAAYGTFEATEVTVSAEVGGRLTMVRADEGASVAAGDLLAAVDTTPLVLQRNELRARRASVQSHAAEVDAQLGVIEAQRAVAQNTYDRVMRLASASAATAQQSDAATRDLRTLEAQAGANRATRASVVRDLAGVDAQIASLEDRIRRSRIVAPGAGTVLAKYVEPGELAAPGTPIARIAALDSLIFRAYVAENQLSQLRLGASVVVQVDSTQPGTLSRREGRVTWVASKAEFTPTPIQTRDERVTQVYAVKVAVANPGGALKIGMPGELVLAVPPR
ncbi:MAG TPA: HlyD family efflux transporter periplasmic adaptor subunit [Gemmatimonadaceae bacterium]|nr:HlyD family efflux transporter periplasmic adaptor subunit [Gemmatimonadaceae bacterium]